jgi:hypothetical protein
MFNCPSHGLEDIVQAHQPQPSSSCGSSRQTLEQPVDGFQNDRPSVTRAQYVPGTKNCSAKPRVANYRLARGTHLDVRLHNGSGLCDADVHKMRHSCLLGRRDGSLQRHQVDRMKALGLPRRRMRRSDQVNVRVEPCRRECRSIERVADKRIGITGKLVFRSLSAERTNKVASLAEAGYKGAPIYPVPPDT